LRFSVVKVAAKDPKKTADIDLAADTIARAGKEGRESYRAQDKAWYFEEKNSKQDGVPIWLRFWRVGYRNRAIIISLCCGAKSRRHPLVNETLALVPTLISTLSLRKDKSPLTAMEIVQLDRQRKVVSKILRESHDLYLLPKIRSDLATLQHLVDDKGFSIHQKHEWSCIGVAFGDVLANELGLDWVTHCDEHGAEPALNLANTSITVFPRTMILKRVEKGERVDLAFLLERIQETVDDMRSKGY
jgi:hypothetical protein